MRRGLRSGVVLRVWLLQENTRYIRSLSTARLVKLNAPGGPRVLPVDPLTLCVLPRIFEGHLLGLSNGPTIWLPCLVLPMDACLFGANGEAYS